MPEEYVYKIVVDDSNVNKTIDGIDQRVVALAQRMDAMFKQEGAGLLHPPETRTQTSPTATSRDVSPTRCMGIILARRKTRGYSKSSIGLMGDGQLLVLPAIMS